MLMYIRLLHRAIREPAAFEEMEATLQEQFTTGSAESREALETMANLINNVVPPDLRME